MSVIKNISASEFKQKCLSLMDEVASLGIEFIITKHGTPLCKLTQVVEIKKNRFGRLKNSLTINCDLTESVKEKWEASI